MNVIDREEKGVMFRVVGGDKCPFRLPTPHWVAEKGKPVTVIPPTRGINKFWLVYAPLSSAKNGIYKFAADVEPAEVLGMAAELAKE